MRLAACLVLVSGLGQNFARGLAAAAGRQVWDHGNHALWMTPLGDAILWSAILLIMVVLGSVARPLRRPGVAWALLTFPLFFTALLLAPRLHLWAKAIVALGLAVRAGSWAEARPDTAGRLVGWVLPRSAILTAILALPMALWPTISEWRATAGLPAAREGTPNVLLLIWDTVRAASLDLYGSPDTTAPNLTRFAAEGMVFDRAMATSSYTLPTHASIFTGRWAHELSTDWRKPLNREPRTLAEALAGAGYRTGGFSANRIFVKKAFGLGRGFAHFDEHRLGFQNMVRSSTLVRWIANLDAVRDFLGFHDALARVSAEMNHESLVRWLERDRSHPYFAFVNFMDAHEPYLPVAPWDTAFGWFAPDLPEAARRDLRRDALIGTEVLPPERARQMEPAYEGAIAQLDAATASMLDDMRGRGLLDNTIVIIAADHGEGFGEHGTFGHGNGLYYELLHVPLVIVHPGHVPIGRVTATVSTRQIGATILDLLGLQEELPGGSLRALWEGEAPAGNAVFSELRTAANLPRDVPISLGDMMSAINDSVQVIVNTGAATEAFRTTGLAAASADTSIASIRELRTLLPPFRRTASTSR